METRIVRYRTAGGVRCGAVSVGRKHLYFIAVDHPIRVQKLSKNEQRYMTDLPYPPAKFKRTIRQMAKAGGCTLSNKAREMLGQL